MGTARRFPATTLAILATLLSQAHGISKTFTNTAMPELRPTFVVNFDMATVICQHSKNASDLHIHEISVLCDGTKDCYSNPALDDESFPYCEKKCDSSCSGRGACLFDGLEPKCYCNSGFSGPACEIIDRNECADQPCSWFAHCTDSVGNFSCSCYPGFAGDGFHCADIDECSVPQSICPEHADCVNLPGSHYCNCTEGYSPRGMPVEKCVDIDECALGLHDCRNWEMCQNTEGSFTCVTSSCDEGYELIAGKCEDIDECRRDHACDARAECTNFQGGYNCTCDEGWAGDGKSCFPATDCTKSENICDRHAFCVHSLKMCFCQNGYAGDGYSCHDVNECMAKEEPCAKNSDRCVNVHGGYICCDGDKDDDECIKEQGAFCAGGCGLHAMCFNETCACQTGFVGDPMTKCHDVNECEDATSCKGVGQWCVNVMGSSLCCDATSKERECQGIHAFKLLDKEVIVHDKAAAAAAAAAAASASASASAAGAAPGAARHALHREGSQSVAQDSISNIESGGETKGNQGGFITFNEGLLKRLPEGFAFDGPLPAHIRELINEVAAINGKTVNDNGDMECTGYCPANSECVDGVCKCGKGYKGLAIMGCEDINECLEANPCLEDGEHWCQNFDGGYACCSKENTTTECMGLELTSDSDGRVKMNKVPIGGGIDIVERNETVEGDTLTKWEFEEVRFSNGSLVFVPSKTPSGSSIIDGIAEAKGVKTVGGDMSAFKGEKGEAGLEIGGGTTSAPLATSTIVSVSGGERTTVVAVTAIPVVTTTFYDNKVIIDTVGPKAVTASSASSTSSSSSSSAASSAAASAAAKAEAKGGNAHGSAAKGAREGAKASEAQKEVLIERGGQRSAQSGGKIAVIGGDGSEGGAGSGGLEGTGFGDLGAVINEGGLSGTQKPLVVEIPSSQEFDKLGLEIRPFEPTDATGITDIERGGSRSSSSGGRINVTSGGGHLGTRDGTEGAKGPIGSEEAPRSTEEEDSNETGLEIIGFPSPASRATTVSTKIEAGTTAGPSIVTDGGEDSDLLGHNGTKTTSGPTIVTDGGDDEDLLKGDGTKPGTGGTTTPASITESGEHPESVGKDGEKGTTVTTIHGTNDGAETTTGVPSQVPTKATAIVTESGEKIDTTDKDGSTPKPEGTSQAGTGTTTPSTVTESGEHHESVGKDGTTAHGTIETATKATTMPVDIVTDSGEEVTVTISESSTPAGPGTSPSGHSAGTTPSGAVSSGATTPQATGSSPTTLAPTGTDGTKATTPSTTSVGTGSEGTTIGRVQNREESTTASSVTGTQGTSPGAKDGSAGTTLAPKGTDETAGSTPGSKATVSSSGTTAKIDGPAGTTPVPTGTESPVGTTAGDKIPDTAATPVPKETKEPTATISGSKAPESGTTAGTKGTDGTKPTAAPASSTSAPTDGTKVTAHGSIIPEATTPTDTAGTTTPASITESGEHSESVGKDGLTPVPEGPGGSKATTPSALEKSTGLPVEPLDGDDSDLLPKTTVPAGTKATTAAPAEATTPETGLEIVGSTPSSSVTAGPEGTTVGAKDGSETPKPRLNVTFHTAETTKVPDVSGKATTPGATSVPDVDGALRENTQEKVPGTVLPGTKPTGSGTTPGSTATTSSSTNETVETTTPQTGLEIVGAPTGTASGSTGSTAGTTETHKSTVDARPTATTPSFTDATTKQHREPTTTEHPETETVLAITTRQFTSKPLEATLPARFTSTATPVDGTSAGTKKTDGGSQTGTTPQNGLESSTSPTSIGTDQPADGTKPGTTPAGTKPADGTTAGPGEATGTTAAPKNTEATTAVPDGTRKPLDRTPAGTDKPVDGTTVAPVDKTDGTTAAPVDAGTKKPADGTSPGTTATPIDGSAGTKKPADGTTVGSIPVDGTTVVPVDAGTKKPTDGAKDGTTIAPETPTGTTKDTFSLVSPTPTPKAPIATTSSKCRSSDECGEDAYCERRTGVCRCASGFEGAPPGKTCEDINECEEGLHDCDKSARCHNYVGGFACFCPMGYRKAENRTCVDIDECAESAGTCCPAHAHCTNKPGSYACECDRGYTGDGYNCMPVEKRACNPTEEDQAACGRNHVCMVDGFGTTDCTKCRAGFEKKRGECVDIDECASPALNMCSSNAACKNVPGTYTCQCAKGYRGDGMMCTDIDECAGPMAPCHPQAACANAPGTFACTCPDGWEGDGVKDCVNPLKKDCSDLLGTCGRVAHVDCLSVRVFDGSVQSVCECEAGYRFNNRTNSCEDIDECYENRHNCDPASSHCVNIEGGFECECEEGYEGRGGVCVDVDECTRGTAGCHPMARCINQAGSCGCSCPEGYTGDGTSCEEMNKPTGAPKGICPPSWIRLCELENKTCLVDGEDVPQCGSCAAGHHPINGVCQPIAGVGSCASSGAARCSPNAVCIDVKPDRHFCSCNVGFIGDGIKCDGPNCHLAPGMCHKEARCGLNGACACKEGFRGDGVKSCEAIPDGTPAAAPTAGSTTLVARREPVELVTDAATSPPLTATLPPSSFITEKPEPEVDVSHGTPKNPATTKSHRKPEDSKTIEEPGQATDEGKRADEELPARCTATDRSMCHVFALCDVVSGDCACKPGYEGDGYTTCQQSKDLDCVVNPSVCHVNATCDASSRRCECGLGMIGDGYLCEPHPLDCVHNPNLCGAEAICSGRKCQCVEGFTGDGIKCVSIYQRSANCTECDTNAHCGESGVCECNRGYFGNGMCCVPDPRDCVHFPGVCHNKAGCDADSRQCKCEPGFLGDGISCFPVRSCRSDQTVCSPHAVCLPSGSCLCRHGFTGDGFSCERALPFSQNAAGLDEAPSACEKACDADSELCRGGSCVCRDGYERRGEKCHDVNECLRPKACHHLAACYNTPGDYECHCPEGYLGDGKEVCIEHLRVGQLGVLCENDGMTLMLSNDTEPFEGRMFVRGQAENPHCAKAFTSLRQSERPYTFKIPYEHCNVKLENKDTFATTVIVQRHPMFITTAAEAYDLRCTYPLGIKEVSSHVNVSDPEASKTLSDQATGPICKLSVTNSDNEHVSSAIVGESLTLQLSVQPNETYSILPRNCFAVNIETGERYSLTDKAGCAIDDQLFPQWSRTTKSSTTAIFKTFKWPDSSMIRFQCDCSACVGECPELDCSRRAVARRRFRMRRARHTQEDAKEEKTEEEKEAAEDQRISSAVVDSQRLAMSSLVAVAEEGEGHKNGSARLTDVFSSEEETTTTCLRAILVGLIVCLTLIVVGILAYMGVKHYLRQRRGVPEEGGVGRTASHKVTSDYVAF